MISRIYSHEFTQVLHVVNDSAKAYRGTIPKDQWREPYMQIEELKEEIEGGIKFYGWMENNVVVAVMGIQPFEDVTLIRHAYVLTSRRRRGIGGKLLKHLLKLARTPVVLVGTWKTAYWAIRFYEKHGFRLLSERETDRLLRKYWSVSERQIETSVVLKLKK